MEQEIFRAIEEGDYIKVQNIISGPVIPYQHLWDNGYSLLLHAMQHRHYKIAEWLILKDCNVDTNIHQGHSDRPIHLAIYDRNLNIVKLILEKRVNLETRSATGNTPFQIAFFMEGTNEILKSLVKCGADVSAVFLFENSLQSTLKVDIEKTSVLKYEVNNTDRNGAIVMNCNILYLAVQKGNAKWVKKILRSNPDVTNDKNRQAFFLALCSVGPKSEEILTLLKTKFSVLSEDRDQIDILFECIRRNHTDDVKKFLNSITNMNLKCDSSFCCQLKCSLLHTAVKYGRTEIIKILVENGADLNAENITGVKPISYALTNGDSDTVKLLLNFGAHEGQIIDKEPLFSAIQENDEQLVKHLLEKGWDANAINSKGRAPLQEALSCGDITYDLLEIVRHLLNYRANIDQVYANEETALVIAVQNNYLEIISEMLERKPSIYVKGNKTAFLLSIMKTAKNMKDIVFKFRECGFHVNENDAKDERLIYECVMNGYTSILHELLKCGADPNMTCHVSYCCTDACSLFHVIVYNNREFSKTVANLVKLLVKYGGDINKLNRSEEKPIHHLIHERNVKMAEIFLQNGADVRDEYSSQLMMGAAESLNWDMVKILINYSADKNAIDEKGRTLMCHAVEKNVDLFQLLLDKGINLQNNGMALLTAARLESKELIEEFVKRGADVNYRDPFGLTAMHYAAWNKDKDSLILLESLGARLFPLENNGEQVVPLQVNKLNKKIEFCQNILKKNGGNSLVDNSTMEIKDITDIEPSQIETDEKKKRYPQLLSEAIESRKWMDVQRLIKDGADINFTDDKETTLMGIALENNIVPLYQLLLAKGFDVKQNSISLLTATKLNLKAVVKEFLKRGADVNFYDVFGTTPLHFAVWYNDEELVRFFLSNGARIYCRDRDGIDYLLGQVNNYPCDPQTKMNVYTTPIHIASADVEKLSILKLLLGCKETRIDCIDGESNTCLHVASKTQQHQIIKILLDYGASLTCTNDSDETPFCIYLGTSTMHDGYIYKFRNHYGLKSNMMVADKYVNMEKHYIKHVVKQEAVEAFLTADIASFFFTTDNDFCIQCEEEIESMWDDKICPKFTFFELLTKHVRVLARQVQKDEVNCLFDSHRIDINYPIYANILWKQLNDAERRRRLIEDLEVYFSLSPFGFPHLVSQQLFEYLSETELNNLHFMYNKLLRNKKISLT